MTGRKISHDATTVPLALVGVFALLGALFCVSAYSGAAESKRIARSNQENISSWQK